MDLINKKITKIDFWLALSVVFLMLVIFDLLVYLDARDDSVRLVEEIEQSEATLDNDVDRMVTEIMNRINNTNNSDPQEWALYQSRQYGISFRYPGYYSEKEFPGNQGKDEPAYTLGLTAYNDEFSGRIYFMVFESSLEAALGNAAASLKDVNIDRTIKIAGNTGIKITGTASGGVISKNKDAKVAVSGFESQGRSYVFVSEDNEVLAKLLSTVLLK